MLFSLSKKMAEENPTRFEQAWNFKKSVVEGLATTQRFVVVAAAVTAMTTQVNPQIYT